MIDFELPEELIAQEPSNPRDSAKLLVYDRKSGQITDTVFSEIATYLQKDTTLVVNNSKVEHCRWLFDEGKTEIFVLEKLDTHTIRALVRPGKKFKLGVNVEVNEFLSAEVTNIDEDGIRTLKLNITHEDERLKEIEHVPLPPYIMQNDELAEDYQTIYAKPLGSKAAPTAGLHFTDNLLGKLKSDFGYAEVTLHVGLGTFANLTDDNYKTGKLHSEWFVVDAENHQIIAEAGHITAVGTTSARTLETFANRSNVPALMLARELKHLAQPSIENSEIHRISSGPTLYSEVSGDTDIFIQPGYEFKKVDSLITNFHLPGTSLLLMVEALVGSESEMQKIYDHAIANKYRFYSFGDAMLVL